MRPLHLLLCFLILNSCVLGPQPRAPDTPVPSSIRGDSTPHGLSFGESSWRMVFTDSTLRSLIERAIANNPDLTAASYRIEIARAQANVANADWFPTLNGNTGGSANYVSPNARQVGPGGDRTSESYDIGALLSWEIDLWGRIRRSNEAARANLLVTEYQRDAVQTSLVAAVASAYIELKNLDERLSISKRTAASRQASLKLVTDRHVGGVSSDLEVGQAEALLGQARVAIPVTEQAIYAKENEIRALLGEYPGSMVRGGSLASLDESLKIKGGLPSSLLLRRPDLAAADQAYRSAVAQIGVAEALRLPTLSLTGSGGLLSQELDDLLVGNASAYSIGPRLVGPIFDAGRTKSRSEAAKAQAAEALANHKRAALQAFREAADAINNHVKTGEIAQELSSLVESNRKVASVSNDRFQGGASSYLQVLDSERSLFNSELELADARRDRLLSVVRAFRALGGGWK